MNREYLYLSIFAAVFAVILGCTVDAYEMTRDDKVEGRAANAAMNKPQTTFPFTATSFLIGSATSILAGYVGMRIAVYTNTRTTYQCCSGKTIKHNN